MDIDGCREDVGRRWAKVWLINGRCGVDDK